MSRRSSAQDADATPIPASEERLAAPASQRIGIADPVERFAKARSLAELPPELQDNPFIRHALSMTAEEEAREQIALLAHQEAEALYGDDPRRILAALEAGSHPLQQRQPQRPPAGR